MFRTIVAAFLISTNAFAWGPLGHKIVAQIAESNLTPTALQAVKNIFPNQTLPEVAIWADSIRSQKEWVHTKTWHFVSIPDGDTYEDTTKDPAGDVVEAINNSIKTLKNKLASIEDQTIALKFLIHFVGDVHQPLHVGRAEDRGGNEIQLNFQGRPCNLHSLWDTGLIESQKIGVAEYAKKLQAESNKEDFKPLFNYNQIVKENIELRKQVYDFTNPDLGTDYLSKNINAANGRLLLGGKRLASILNSIYQ